MATQTSLNETPNPVAIKSVSEVTDLMRIYFQLKDQARAIRSERNKYMTENECLLPHASATGDCISQLQESMMGFTLCEVCEKRNAWYMERQQLSHQRSSIIRKIRRLVQVTDMASKGPNATTSVSNPLENKPNPTKEE